MSLHPTVINADPQPSQRNALRAPDTMHAKCHIPALGTPQVALDEPYNQSVDTYSIGVMLWEVLHQRTAFRGMSVEEHRHRVCLRSQRPPISTRLPTVLRDLVAACWDSHHDQRPRIGDVVGSLKGVRDRFRGAAAAASPNPGPLLAGLDPGLAMGGSRKPNPTVTQPVRRSWSQTGNENENEPEPEHGGRKTRQSIGVAGGEVKRHRPAATVEVG